MESVAHIVELAASFIENVAIICTVTEAGGRKFLPKKHFLLTLLFTAIISERNNSIFSWTVRLARNLALRQRPKRFLLHRRNPSADISAFFTPDFLQQRKALHLQPFSSTYSTALIQLEILNFYIPSLFWQIFLYFSVLFLCHLHAVILSFFRPSVNSVNEL